MKPHRSALGAVVLVAAAAALPAQEAGKLLFTDVTEIAGVGLPGVLTESVAWGDYDADGDEDLYLTNDGPNRLFRKDGGGRFDGRGVAFADYDRDGDLDVVVTGGLSASTRLWRNDSTHGHRWLTVRLVGVVSNRSAVGARVEVEFGLGTAERTPCVVGETDEGYEMLLERAELEGCRGDVLCLEAALRRTVDEAGPEGEPPPAAA